MWEEIKTVIFDAASATGLKPGFLANLIAETYGIFFGAFISVYAAHLLDSRRENKRRADHRVRAANRWIKSHYEMLLSVREAGGQVDSDRRKLERRETVRAAIQYAEGIREDYADAVGAPKINAAFLRYVEALERLAEEVFIHAVRTAEVRAVSAEAYKALKELVVETTPRKYRATFRESLDNLAEIAALKITPREEEETPTAKYINRARRLASKLPGS